MNVLSKKGGRNHSLVPQSLDSNTIKDSMQYYRVWICSCNWVLGITSAIFTVFAAFVLADVRLSLLRGVELYHPTFIYAYMALIIQCGVLQTVGCIGAKRLNHKLLSIYWVLLLILTIGDIAVGLVWVFKLEDVKLALRPILTEEFIAKYATDPEFTKTWNRVQTQEHCCGVNGPLDFDKFPTEVRRQILQEQNVGRTEAALYLSLPESCCTNIDTSPSPTQDYAFGPFSLSRPPDKSMMSDGPYRPPVRVPPNPTTIPHPLALFLNVNYSAEAQAQSSEEYDPIPGLVSIHGKPSHHLNRHRHFVHPRKKAGYSPGPLSTESNNSQSFGGDNSNPKPTEEPLEITEISVPFTCRNPDPDHLHTRRELSHDLDSDPDMDSEDVDTTTTAPGHRRRRHASIPQTQHSPTSSPAASGSSLPPRRTRVRIYRNGCGFKLTQWLDHISGILFILGFCIIGFIKACFLIILRYEIREMIEKIHTLDSAEDLDSSSSPSRLALLQKQSSLSSGQCHFTGVTIKSPQGDGGHKCFHERNSFVSGMSVDRTHHAAGCCKGRDHRTSSAGMRRPSGRSLCECDRNSSHSQETVNMTLLITTQQKSEDSECGGGSVSVQAQSHSEPISLIVPSGNERELRRSRFANYTAWDSNVSAESSTSTGCDFRGGGKTEVVQVEMENLSSIRFVDESLESGVNMVVPPSVEDELKGGGVVGVGVADGEEELRVLVPGSQRLAARRRNGNNNSVDSTDSVMALIGTAV